MYAGGAAAVGVVQGGGGGGIVQELATGSFDSPIDNRQSFIQPSYQPQQQQQQQPPQPLPSQGYSADPYGLSQQIQSPTGAGRPQTPYAPQQQPPAQANPSAITTLPSQQLYQQQQPPAAPSDPYSALASNPYGVSPPPQHRQSLAATQAPLAPDAPAPGPPHSYQAYSGAAAAGGGALPPQQLPQQPGPISRYGFGAPARPPPQPQPQAAVEGAEGFYR